MVNDKIIGAKKTWSPYDLLSNSSKNFLKRFWDKIGLSKEFGSMCRYELDMLLLRISCRFNIVQKKQINNLKTEKGLKVNLGCGWVPIPGWINLDCYPPPKEESKKFRILVLDMRKKLPFENNSVVSIYSEHFMEHLPFRIVRDFLIPECLRILSPGGFIRMGVPDGEVFIKRYHLRNANNSPNVTSNPMPEMMNINDIAHGGGHFYLYDYEVLEKIFKEAGFKNLRKCGSFETHVSYFENLDQDDEWRIKNTVFIEGQKL